MVKNKYYFNILSNRFINYRFYQTITDLIVIFWYRTSIAKDFAICIKSLVKGKLIQIKKFNEILKHYLK